MPVESAFPFATLFLFVSFDIRSTLRDLDFAIATHLLAAIQLQRGRDSEHHIHGFRNRRHGLKTPTHQKPKGMLVFCLLRRTSSRHSFLSRWNFIFTTNSPAAIEWAKEEEPKHNSLLWGLVYISVQEGLAYTAITTSSRAAVHIWAGSGDGPTVASGPLWPRAPYAV